MTVIPRQPATAGRARERATRDRTDRDDATGCDGTRSPTLSSGTPWSRDGRTSLARPTWDRDAASWASCAARPESSAVASGRPLDSRWLEFPPEIDEFTEAWVRGEAPDVEAYLNRLDPADSQGAVELIYREYCLAESDGQAPD